VKTFAKCDLQAEGLPEEYREGAMAGCIMFYCSEQHSCTKLDSLWCASCDDMHGAPFWHNLHVAITRCSAKLGWDSGKVAYEACLDEKVEQQCPALEGTDWQASTPKESIRIQYELLQE
jgi:hypothetical protein